MEQQLDFDAVGVPLGFYAFLDEDGEMQYALDVDLDPRPFEPRPRLAFALKTLRDAIAHAKQTGAPTWQAEHRFDRETQVLLGEWQTGADRTDEEIHRSAAEVGMEAFRLLDAIGRVRRAIRPRLRSTSLLLGRALRPMIRRQPRAREHRVRARASGSRGSPARPSREGDDPPTRRGFFPKHLAEAHPSRRLAS